LSAEIKLAIVRAVDTANEAGFSTQRACQVIMLDPRRLRRWIGRAQICPVPETTPPAKRLLGLLRTMFSDPGARRRRSRTSPRPPWPIARRSPMSCRIASPRASGPRSFGPRTRIAWLTCTIASSATNCPERAGCSARSPRCCGCSAPRARSLATSAGADRSDRVPRTVPPSRTPAGPLRRPNSSHWPARITWRRCSTGARARSPVATSARKPPRPRVDRLGQVGRRRGAARRGGTRDARRTLRLWNPDDLPLDPGVLRRPGHRPDVLPSAHADGQRQLRVVDGHAQVRRLYGADTAEMTPQEVEELVDRFIDYYTTSGCTRVCRSSRRPTGTRDVTSPSSRRGGRGCAGPERRGRSRRTEGPGRSSEREDSFTDSGQRVWRSPPAGGVNVPRSGGNSEWTSGVEIPVT
jgi:hypothetical protein